MKKVILLVVVAFGMFAPTFAQVQFQNQPNNQQLQPGSPTLPYYAPVPPQVIVKNYPQSPTVRVTNPEVTVPVTIQQLPQVAPTQNPDDFNGQQILSMLLIAGISVVIGFIWGFFRGRRESSGPQRPIVIHNYGGRGGNASSILSVENNE